MIDSGRPDWDALKSLEAEQQRRMRLFVLAFGLWTAVNLVFDILVFLPQGAVFYLTADGVAVVLVALGLLLSRRRPPRSRGYDLGTLFFSLGITVWSAVVSGYQGSPYTVLIASFVVAILIYLPWLSATLWSTGAMAAYLLSAHHFGNAPFGAGLVQTLEVAAMLLAAAVLSSFMHRERRRRFEAEVRLQEVIDSQEAQLRDRTEDLRRRLSEREVLMREVHHRVKNNLQVLASLFNLQRSFNPESAHERLLQSANNHIHSMALVHKQLYESEYLHQLDLGAYLSNLVDNVVAAHAVEGEIAAVKRLESHFVSIDTATGVGLLVTEALSNACLHAFTSTEPEPLITVLLSLEGESLVLEVRDNGRGLTGGGQTEGGGLGHLLMEGLAEQLSGTLRIDSGEGTVVRLEIPRMLQVEQMEKALADG